MPAFLPEGIWYLKSKISCFHAGKYLALIGRAVSVTINWNLYNIFIKTVIQEIRLLKPNELSVIDLSDIADTLPPTKKNESRVVDIYQV